MKHTSTSVCMISALVLTILSGTVDAAQKLSTRDVIAHCSAQLDAMSPGASAKGKALTAAEIEQFDANDGILQKLNSADATPDGIAEMIKSTREDKYDPADTSKLKSVEQLAFDNYFICMLQLRIDQLNGKNLSTHSAGTAEKSLTSDTLNQGQIDACSNDIKAMQVQSQSWPGDVNENAARLGLYQKDMFEGRCAGHPEAQAYINSANRMMGYSAGSGSGGSSSNGSSASKNGKRSNVPEANASHCLAPQKEGGVINNCPYAVEYSYCVVQPKSGSWSASFDCNQGKSGSWQVGPNSRAIMQTNGAQVAFFGCKYGPTLSKPDGISPADFRYNPNGLPSGRCREWGAP